MQHDANIMLASGSRARRDMLRASGIGFTVEPANVDEDAIRLAMTAGKANGELEHADIAEILAAAKAESVSKLHPDAYVIGGDQVLAFEGAILTKPKDQKAARRQLASFRGKVHALHSAVALAHNGEVVWSTVETAEMHVRNFTDAFLDEYMTRAGRTVLDSVGAYLMEGLGIQLFERIEGDYFTVLGMPLMPLLAELRARRIILQ